MPQSELGAKGGGNENSGGFDIVIRKEGPLEVFKQRNKTL